MNDKLILPFDKCYCLHLAEDNKRFFSLITQFKKLGIKDQVDIWWTCKRPISNEIGKKLTGLHDPGYIKLAEVKPNIWGGIFNCAFEHYTMIKQAYLRGFNSILIMEDDIIFDHDKQYYIDIFNNLPEDWDILRLGYWDDFSVLVTDNIEYDKTQKFVKFNECGFPGTCMYALSRRGMEYYIKCMDYSFSPSDYPFMAGYKFPTDKYYDDFRSLNVYIANETLVYVGKFYSNIIEDGYAKQELLNDIPNVRKK